MRQLFITLLTCLTALVAAARVASQSSNGMRRDGARKRLENPADGSNTVPIGADCADCAGVLELARGRA